MSASDLSVWLLERITEDESMATADLADGRSLHARRKRAERVLAECEAKRRVLTLHRPEHAQGWTSCNVCHSGWSSELEPADWPCDTIKLLAEPLAHRPGYREERRP